MELFPSLVAYIFSLWSYYPLIARVKVGTIEVVFPFQGGLTYQIGYC